MKKVIIILLLIISMSCVVYAIPRYTTLAQLYRLDRVLSLNQSGNNFTADKFFGSFDNVIKNGTDANLTKLIMTGNINLTGNKLTDVGELIVDAISLKGDMTPYTDDLFSLGSSEKWFKEIWARQGYFNELNATNLTAKSIKSVEGNLTNLTTAFILADTDKDIIIELGG